MPDDYHAQIAQMRAERHQRESAERLQEIEREYSETIEQRDSADDPAVWRIHDEAAEALEQEYSQLAPAPSPAPTYTDTELDVMRKHAPAEYGRPHWTQQSKFNTGQKLSNEEIVRSGAAYAQSRYVQERAARGLQTSAEDLASYRNSPDYKAALEFFEPVEQGGVSSPDEFIEEYNRNSKFKLDAKTYNKGAKKLIAGKARGDYPDR